jgi:hypothetical protein
MTTRIYVVTRKNAEHRLVRAASQAQAIGYCVRDDYAAEVATQEQLVGLRHIEVENAKEATAGTEPQA